MNVGRRFCGCCGQELMPAARFCGTCGDPVPESADEALEPTIVARRPPVHAPYGTGPPRPGAHARPDRQSVLLWPAVAVLAVALAGGGFVASLALIRHFHGQPGLGDNLAKLTPTIASPTSPAPHPPPTQLATPGTTIGIGAVNTDPDATAVAATLATFFGGINIGKYAEAWDTYTAALQAVIPFQSFATAVSTSQDSQVVVQSIRHDANGKIEADVSFQSHQAGQYGPSQGETCTNWSLDYHLVPGADATAGAAPFSYRIDQVTDIGAGHTSC